MRISAVLLTGILMATPALALFGPKGETVDEKRTTVRNDRREILQDLYADQPELKHKVSAAAGYATFSTVNIHLLLVSTANGHGVVIDNSTGKETFMRMASLGGGLGAGVKDFRALFIFNDRKTMDEFIEHGWQFGGQADAALKSGDKGLALGESMSVSTDLEEGGVDAGVSGGLGSVTKSKTAIEIYQITDAGVALQASISGTKYWKYKSLNK